MLRIQYHRSMRSWSTQLHSMFSPYSLEHKKAETDISSVIKGKQKLLTTSFFSKRSFFSMAGKASKPTFFKVRQTTSIHLDPFFVVDLGCERLHSEFTISQQEYIFRTFPKSRLPNRRRNRRELLGSRKLAILER